MQAISQAVDSDIIAEGIRSAGRTVAGTADATDLKDLANIAKGFDLAAVPVANRRLVLHPTHKYRYLTTDNLTKVAYAGTGDALRNAELGQIYGLDTYMSQNAPDTLAEKSGTATVAKITCTAGAETVALSGVTAAAGTIKKVMDLSWMDIFIALRRIRQQPPGRLKVLLSTSQSTRL